MPGVAGNVRCPTCGGVSPKDKDQRFWWDCWPCLLCAKNVCNQPVVHADKSTLGAVWARSATGPGRRPMTATPCYVKHLAEKHGHVYERADRA